MFSPAGFGQTIAVVDRSGKVVSTVIRTQWTDRTLLTTSHRVGIYLTYLMRQKPIIVRGKRRSTHYEMHRQDHMAINRVGHLQLTKADRRLLHATRTGHVVLGAHLTMVAIMPPQGQVGSTREAQLARMTLPPEVLTGETPLMCHHHYLQDLMIWKPWSLLSCPKHHAPIHGVQNPSLEHKLHLRAK